jgi:LemA protein
MSVVAPRSDDGSGARGPRRWFGWGLLALVAALLVWVLSQVNAVPRLQEAVKAAWAQVENTYQRRADLIPNLVETVKGYAQQEKDVLTAVVEARAKATGTTVVLDPSADPAQVQAFEQNQQALTEALARLLVVVEAYPELKSSEAFLALQAQLEGTENRIAVARRDFIAAVQDYNTTIRGFPGLIWALIYGAEPLPSFAAQPGAAEAPKVNFTQ